MSLPRKKRSGAALSEDTRKQTEAQEDSELAQAQRYEQLQNAYIDRNPTQQALLYLKRVASDGVIPMEFKRYPLLRLLSEIAKDLLMNELEVVGWSVYLDRFVWGSDPANLHQLLQFSGLAVKCYFDSDVDIITAHIKRKNHRLYDQFEAWKSLNEGSMKILPKEMNSKFRKLNAFPDPADLAALLDYNYIVDEILQLSPPYNSLELEPGAEAEEEMKEETQPAKEEPGSPESFEPISLSRNGSLNSDFGFPTSMLRQASTSDFWETRRNS